MASNNRSNNRFLLDLPTNRRQRRQWQQPQSSSSHCCWVMVSRLLLKLLMMMIVSVSYCSERRTMSVVVAVAAFIVAPTTTSILSPTVTFAPSAAADVFARRRKRHTIFVLHDATKREEDATTSSSSSSSTSSMRVAEIRQALKELDVDYSDCFDKESLLQRLQDAQAGNIPTSTSTIRNEDEQEQQPAPVSNSSGNDDSTKGDAPDEEEGGMDGQPTPPSGAASSQSTTKTEPSSKQAPDSKTGNSSSPTTDTTRVVFDETAEKEQVKQMSVKELRQELASRNLRWAGLLEKQDLVNAVVKARKAASTFSVTGKLTPGQVADVTGEELALEMMQGGGHDTRTAVATPLLVDVYATWCGPCQLMAGQLKEAAALWQDKIRVVKLDSDKHNTMASQLHSQGLPTLILFDASGNELDRMEGALMKDQLVEWVESKI